MCFNFANKVILNLSTTINSFSTGFSANVNRKNYAQKKFPLVFYFNTNSNTKGNKKIENYD